MSPGGPDRARPGRGREPGPSLRLQLALSYACFLVVAGGAMAGVLLLVLRYVPEENLVVVGGGGFVPNRSDLLRVAVPLSVMGIGVLAVVGLAGGWLLAGRVLRPLDRISAAARTAAQGSLGHRVTLQGRDDELRRLADDFDEMLFRLERAFEEQRAFTANASHELRTPHAVMKTMVQVARADPDGRDVDVLLARLEEMIDRSSATLESLLQLARLDRHDIRYERCDLVEVVEEVLTPAVEAPAAGGVRVMSSLGRAEVVGSRPLLDQLVGNLVRNAILHNVPVGGMVWVDVTTDAGGRPSLTVTNTGEVVEPEVVTTLTEPFVRAGGRGRRRGGPGGSGLGLAIVSSIARAHRADLDLRARPGGGLAVAVRFPAGPLTGREGELGRLS